MGIRVIAWIKMAIIFIRCKMTITTYTAKVVYPVKKEVLAI